MTDANTPQAGTNSLLLRRSVWVKIRRFLIFSAGIYFVLLYILYAKEKDVVFTGVNQGAVVTAPYGVDKISLQTSSGDTVVAFFGRALLPNGYKDPEYSKRPTILYFYGSGDNLRASEPQLEAFRRLGANVLIPDYVGYGMSSGQVSENGCFATATAAYNYLAARKDLDRSKIVVLGWSLGSGVAIDLAARKPVAGLGIFSAFTSMAELTNKQYPIFPTSLLQLLLEHSFDSESKMFRVKCPILIGHSRSDLLVPISMSSRLAAESKAPITTITIDHANHSDFFNLGGPTVYPAIGQFIQTLPAVKLTH
jgi:fermentation-respiration switch protein FrsA (DUF1100 family)